MATSGLANYLIKDRILTKADCIMIAKESGPSGGAFAKFLLSVNLFTEETLVQYLTQKTNLPIFSITKQTPLSVAGILDLPLITQLEVVPMALEKGKLTVIMVDPLDRNVMEQLMFFSHYKIKPAIGQWSHIHHALKGFIKDFSPAKNTLEIFLEKRVLPPMRVQLAKELQKQQMTLNTLPPPLPVSAPVMLSKPLEPDLYADLRLEGPEFEDAEDSLKGSALRMDPEDDTLEIDPNQPISDDMFAEEEQDEEKKEEEEATTYSSRDELPTESSWDSDPQSIEYGLDPEATSKDIDPFAAPTEGMSFEDALFDAPISVYEDTALDKEVLLPAVDGLEENSLESNDLEVNNLKADTLMEDLTSYEGFPEADTPMEPLLKAPAEAPLYNAHLIAELNQGVNHLGMTHSLEKSRELLARYMEKAGHTQGTITCYGASGAGDTWEALYEWGLTPAAKHSSHALTTWPKEYLDKLPDATWVSLAKDPSIGLGFRIQGHTPCIYKTPLPQGGCIVAVTSWDEHGIQDSLLAELSGDLVMQGVRKLKSFHNPDDFIDEEL